MKKIYKLDDGRLSVFSLLFENSNKNSFGLIINFCSQEWEINIGIGYIFGKLYISFPHKFLYRNFKRIFNGKNFGEHGREIGFMIDNKWQEYSLFWWSDPNRPISTWRARFNIID